VLGGDEIGHGAGHWRHIIRGGLAGAGTRRPVVRRRACGAGAPRGAAPPAMEVLGTSALPRLVAPEWALGGDARAYQFLRPDETKDANAAPVALYWCTARFVAQIREAWAPAAERRVWLGFHRGKTRAGRDGVSSHLQPK
jgi:hypothetical protein